MTHFELVIKTFMDQPHHCIASDPGFEQLQQTQVLHRFHETFIMERVRGMSVRLRIDIVNMSAGETAARGGFFPGIQLRPAEAEPADERHKIFVERVEDEYYVRIDHDMTKSHYISFVAALSPDRMQLVRLYPEGNAEARFSMHGVKKFLFWCNRDGLFRSDIVKGIDDRDRAYDDTEERRALEKAADRLFG